MSRTLLRGAPLSPPGSNPMADICPVCKSNRYLNPNLKFQINAECYHTMCTSCVERLFHSGPAPCPVAGCHKTLRKKGFHAAFFADLTVEREVDVRKRVFAVFNRTQDEFETLHDWNNYLEEIETLVFEIVNGTESERKKAEERVRIYKEENKKEIEENKAAEIEAAEEEKRRENAQLEMARRRREKAAREVRQEKEVIERTKRGLLEKLAGSEGDAAELSRQADRVIRSTQDKLRGDSADAGTREDRHSGFPIRGLKRKVATEPEKPYDPFGGIDLTPSRYVLQGGYENEWLEMAKTDSRHMAGGYSLSEYYTRTMFEAFSGLGVFIEDEAAAKATKAVGTVASQITVGGAGNASDDVF